MMANAESRRSMFPLGYPYYVTSSWVRAKKSDRVKADETVRIGPFSSLALPSGHEAQRAEVVELGAGLRSARPPVFVVEGAEVALPFLLLVEIPDREIKPQPRLAERGAPEHAGLHLQAGVRTDPPLDHVALPAREGLRRGR